MFINNFNLILLFCPSNNNKNKLKNLTGVILHKNLSSEHRPIFMGSQYGVSPLFFMFILAQ